MIVLAFLLVLFWRSSFCQDFFNDNNDLLEDPYDLNGPCRGYLQNYGSALHDVIHCATNYTSPPKFCLECNERYQHFKSIKENLKYVNSTSLSNDSCFNVLNGGTYPLSFDWLLTGMIEEKFWQASNCERCWTSDSQLNSRTEKFMQYFSVWKDCLNASTNQNFTAGNFTAICVKCKAPFNDLFKYYWHVTADAEDGEGKFCLDIDTIMNDTNRLWKLWDCPNDPGGRDTQFLIFTAVFLFTVTTVFYAGSYIQVDRAETNLVQYSRLDPPGGLRTRILGSSSALANDYDATSPPSSSSHSAQSAPSRLVAPTGYGRIS